MSAPPISTKIIHRRLPVNIHRFLPGKLQPVGARQIRGIAATDALSPIDNFALVIAGGDLSRLQDGQLCWDHVEPIGRVLEAHADGHNVIFTGDFGPAGVDAEVDTICAKAKAGIISNVSMSFRITDAAPIVPGRPELGMKATKWEALEISLCLVNVDPGAKITQRSRHMRNMNAMTSALAHTEQALEQHAAATRHLEETQASFDGLREHHRALKSGLRALHRALEAGDAQAAAECHGRCSRAVDGITRESRLMQARHADAIDAHAALARSLNDAESGLDTQAIQTSTGIHDDQGSRSQDFRRRQAELRRLAAAPDDGRLADLERLRRR